MGFSLKKLLEGATLKSRMNDGGKTFATVVRNQPVQSQPAKTPHPLMVQTLLNKLSTELEMSLTLTRLRTTPDPVLTCSNGCSYQTTKNNKEPIPSNFYEA